VGDIVVGMDTDRVYVAADDCVTVMAGGDIAERIPVGPDTKRLLLSADEAVLYVVGYDGSVRFISAADHTVTTIAGRPSTAEVVSPDGRHLYTAHPAASLESAYSQISASASDGTSAGTVAVKNYATGMDVSPEGGRLYIATSTVSTHTQFFPGWVTVIDTAQHTVVDSIAVPVSPDTVTVSPDGSRVLVTHYDTNSISAIDVERRSVTSVNLPDAPLRAVATPDGAGVYVVGMQSLVAVDFATKIAEIIPAGRMPRRMQFSADGTRACITDLASSRVAVLDTVNNSLIAAVQLDGHPEALRSAATASRCTSPITGRARSLRSRSRRSCATRKRPELARLITLIPARSAAIRPAGWYRHRPGCRWSAFRPALLPGR
jgi:DNA-binding beta-propeller fold protein YncE